MEIFIYILAFLIAIFIQYEIIKSAINNSILKDILFELKNKSETKLAPNSKTNDLNIKEDWKIEDVGDDEIKKIYESND